MNFVEQSQNEESVSSSKKIEKIQEKLTKFQEEDKEKGGEAGKMIGSYYPRLTCSKGDQFKSILSVNKVILKEGEENKPVDIVHHPGEVLFIDFWATWFLYFLYLI